MIFSNTRRPRTPQGPPLAGYPAPLRRLIFWYDALNDWQRVQYAVAASLFLLACGGYLLGLGSTMVLQRVESEDAALAAQPWPPRRGPLNGWNRWRWLVSESATATRPAPATAAVSDDGFHHRQRRRRLRSAGR